MLKGVRITNFSTALILLVWAAMGASGQETYSGYAGPTQTLSGVIRWKKDLGTVPSGPGKNTADQNPCSPFSILVYDSAEEKLLGSVSKLTWRDTSTEFYVCKYSLTVPAERRLRVWAVFGAANGISNERWLFYAKKPWVGGSKEPPGPGFVRGFGPPRNVTLGKKEMYLAIEMIYDLLHASLPGR